MLLDWCSAKKYPLVAFHCTAEVFGELGLLQQGFSQSDIARRHKVSRQVVSQYVLELSEIKGLYTDGGAA
jgi:hypothetical protein